MRILRSFAVAAGTAALGAALLWGVSFAQSPRTNAAVPAPIAPAAVAAQDAVSPTLEATEPSAYLTLDMAAGFALDPFLVSLNGGGDVDATTLDPADDPENPACVGFVSRQPVLTANWEGAVESLRVFFYSDSDSTLVIQAPDGSYLCNDDSSDNVLDPEVVVTEPVTGTYKLWVGSYDANQLIPGLLVITGRPDFSLADFNPATLVKRQPIAPEEEIVQTPAALAAKAGEEAAAATMAAAEAAPVSTDAAVTDSAAVTATVVAGGTNPSFEVSGDEAVCGGLLADVPDFVLDVPDGLANLRLFFEAEQDTSLVVIHASAAADALNTFCADDNVDGTNANPLLDIPAPEAGIYDVYVGRFDHETPITGTLTVTTDPTAVPAILAPATSTQP
jgi:hypothetical protein